MDEITPAGFELYHVPHENKKGGRVAVLVRNDIDCVLCQTDQWETFKHIAVKLSDRQSSQLLVHVIYRPPSTRKADLLRNSIVSWKQLYCHHMKISSRDISISTLTVKIAGQIISTQFYWILILFNICQHLHTYKDISLMYSALVNP